MHLELVESVKLFTEVTTLLAWLASAAMFAADGLDGNDLTVLSSALIDDVIDDVSLGKSLLAELTSAVASLWIFVSCVRSALTTPPLVSRLVSPLTEFSRLVRLPQYAGLLLPQALSAAIKMMVAPAASTRLNVCLPMVNMTSG